jgi:hypothetical protein
MIINKKKRLIYRIEHRNKCHGMWYNESSIYYPTLLLLCPESTVGALPMPKSDVFKLEGGNWKSSAKDKSNLTGWFPESDVQLLLENGFALYEIVVGEWIELENEILYLEEGLIKKKEISIKDVYIK